MALHGDRQGGCGGLRRIAVAGGADRLVELVALLHVADRLLFDALSRSDYDLWRKRSLHDMEQAGQHEMLNWMALMGAMETLHRRPTVHDYVETHIFMSEKCFVAYPT